MILKISPDGFEPKPKKETMEPIRIIITGGTFDKEYDELTGKLFFRETHVPEMLSLGRSRLQINLEKILMIDSLDMTDADRARILSHCEAARENQLVITHGTDTMEITARVLGERFRNADPSAPLARKTIVLTGAMIPYKFGSSDGLFNLGAALGFAQSLRPGIYVAMNGRFFTWDNVTKNRDSGEFISRQ